MKSMSYALRKGFNLFRINQIERNKSKKYENESNDLQHAFKPVQPL